MTVVLVLMLTCSVHPKPLRVHAVCAVGTARLVRDEVEPDGEQCSHEGGAEPAGGYHPTDAVSQPRQHP